MRGKKNMHREIQIKQFPIVTTHWWPKTQNERFVWENEQYLYRFLPLVHNHVQVIWVRTHIRCVTCVCARSGSRLTEGVSEAWCWFKCHRSCRFWTVFSFIQKNSFISWAEKKLWKKIHLFLLWKKIHLFLELNTKEDILDNLGNQTVAGPHWLW